MKIFISADIEGVAGITHSDEASKSKPEYQEHRIAMTREVVAACEGAFSAGAKEIVIKDAHGSGRNLIIEEMPSRTRLVRGWSGHPFRMMQELDETFDAAMMVGYHAKAGDDSNPLAHTFTGRLYALEINGERASEFLVNTYTAATVDVPVVFVSGDEGICGEVRSFNENIVTTPVSKGMGSSSVSLAPVDARNRIRSGVEDALEANFDRCRVTLPDHFDVALTFRNHADAYRASFYPGMTQEDARTVRFESTEFDDVMRMLLFAK
jgi:D-amino peptidase